MRTKTLSLYFYDYNIFLYSTSISLRLTSATVFAIFPVATTYTLSTTHGMSFFVNPNSVRFVVRSRSCTIRRNASPSSEPSPWLNIRANELNFSELALHVYYTTTGSITARPTPWVISLRPLAGCSIP